MLTASEGMRSLLSRATGALLKHPSTSSNATLPLLVQALRKMISILWAIATVATEASCVPNVRLDSLVTRTFSVLVVQNVGECCASLSNFPDCYSSDFNVGDSLFHEIQEIKHLSLSEDAD